MRGQGAPGSGDGRVRARRMVIRGTMGRGERKAGVWGTCGDYANMQHRGWNKEIQEKNVTRNQARTKNAGKCGGWQCEMK